MVLRWWWLVALGPAVGAAVGLVAISSTSPVYRASSTLLVIPPNGVSNELLARTYAQMATHPLVLEHVQEVLALPLPPPRLADLVTARHVPDTQLVEIIVHVGDAAAAREIANATAYAFIEQQADQMLVGPYGPSLRIGQPAVRSEQTTPPGSVAAVLLGVLVGLLLAIGLAGQLEAAPRRGADLSAGVPRPSQPVAMPIPTANLAQRRSVPRPIRALAVVRRWNVFALTGTALLLVLILTRMVSVRPGASILEQPPTMDSPQTPETGAAGVLTRPTLQIPTTVPDVLAAVPATQLDPEGSPAATETEIAGAAETEIAGATSSAQPAPEPLGFPTETSGVAPSAAAPALPAVAAPPSVPSSLVLFEDRFDAGPQGWPDDAKGPAWYESNGYRLYAGEPNRFVAIQAPIQQPLRDAVVVGTLRKVGGPPGGSYGLIVRDGGPAPRDGVNQVGNYYVLAVDDRGEYGVFRREGDRWLDIVPYTPSDAVRAGTEPNELVVQAVDDRLTLTVNGTPVATVLGAERRFGTIGVYVGGDFNDVLLTRFEVLSAAGGVASGSQAGDTADENRQLVASDENAVPSAEPEPTIEPQIAALSDPTTPDARPGSISNPVGFTAWVLRAAPSTSARSLASLPGGTPIDVLPGTATGDGFTWIRVRTRMGLVGWVVSSAVLG